MEGGILAVRAIRVERQKSSGSLQEYSGSGASGSSGGQQFWSRPPHDPTAAQHACGQVRNRNVPGRHYTAALKVGGCRTRSGSGRNGRRRRSCTPHRQLNIAGIAVAQEARMLIKLPNGLRAALICSTLSVYMNFSNTFTPSQICSSAGTRADSRRYGSTHVMSAGERDVAGRANRPRPHTPA